MADPSLNVAVQLITMTSTITYALNKDNKWEITSADRPVHEQFNAWAEQNDMNPHGPPTAIPAPFRENERRYSIVTTLSVSAIKREDQARLELSYRHQIAQLLGIGSAVGAPAVVPPATQPQPLEPVNVTALAEAAPVPPSSVTLPAAPVPGASDG